MTTPLTPDEILAKQIYLKDIGTSLSDFKEVKKGDKKYFILGSGNFGYAEKMIGKDNKPYAVKKLDINSKKFNMRDFHRETKISIQLNHENFVKFYGYFKDKENITKFKEIKEDQFKKKWGNSTEEEIKKNLEKLTKEKKLTEERKKKRLEELEEDLSFRNETKDKDIYCLVLEFVPHGSLEDYINKYKEVYLNKKKEGCLNKGDYVPLAQDIVIKFLEQSLSALRYLHSKKIVHRDIKLDNMLLDENDNIKISDLGIAARFQEEDDSPDNLDEELTAHCTRVGRRDFVSPEIKKGINYDYRCDIYSLGLTMLYLMLEDKPTIFIKNPFTKENEAVLKGGIFDKLSSYNEYLIKLIKRMLNDDINYRPTSSQCYDELEKIKNIIKNPDDELDKIYLKNKDEPGKRKKNAIKVIIPPNKNVSNQPKLTPQLNYGYSADFSNPYMMSQSQGPYGYGYSQSTQIASQYPSQYYLMGGYAYPNQNQYYQNFSKNSSLASVIQCLSYCFKDYELTNFKFCCQNSHYFSYDIVNMIERVNTNCCGINFLMSLQTFRNKASNFIQNFKGTEEIEPIWVYFGLCNYINNEFRNNNSICPNTIYRDFKELEEVPKSRFPRVYQTIETFKKDYHSNFVNNFYYILLDLIKCPNCDCVLNAEIKDGRGVSSFIPLLGILIDKVSNLLDNYISKQSNSNFVYRCSNCNYNGPGKNEVGFLNTPKYLLFSFEGEKEIKTLDDTLDLTNYSLVKNGKNKYNLLSFITNENDRYKAYIKNDKGVWCSYNEENAMEEDVLIIKCNVIPYIVIYEKE